MQFNKPKNKDKNPKSGKFHFEIVETQWKAFF